MRAKDLTLIADLIEFMNLKLNDEKDVIGQSFAVNIYDVQGHIVAKIEHNSTEYELQLGEI